MLTFNCSVVVAQESSISSFLSSVCGSSSAVVCGSSATSCSTIPTPELQEFLDSSPLTHPFYCDDDGNVVVV